MSRRTLLVAVTLLALAGAWLLRTTLGERRGAGARESVGASSGHTAEPAALAPPPRQADHEPARTAPRPARPLSEDEMGAPIEGLVLLPGPIPAGETVRVTAALYGVSRLYDECASIVADDGTFSLRMPLEAEYGELYLDSRYLELPEPVRVLHGETGVVLAPIALAVLVGRVVLPPGGLGSAAWADLRLNCHSLDGDVEAVADRFPHALELEGPLFVLEHVPVGIRLRLTLHGPVGPDALVNIPALAPGERREVVVELHPGASVSGTVVDQHGTPVADAVVGITQGLPGRGPRLREGPTTTDEQGRFTLEGLPRAELELRVHGDELARSSTKRVDTRGGDVTGVEITVERGGCIEGTVTWSDGEPVEAFDVSITGTTWGKSERGSAGAFEVCGLPDELFEVRIRARGDDARAGTAWTRDARVGDVIELVITREGTFLVTGTAVDTTGAAIERFQVTAISAEHGQEATGSAEGSFTLAGLAPGSWLLSAEARGHLEQHLEVEVGPATPPVHFVLERAGRLSGQVVDPAGAPVAGARVVARPTAESVLSRSPRVMTDDEGRFSLDAPDTSVRLVASGPGGAPSAPLSVELGPAEQVVGLVLRLRSSCWLEGRVVDHEGEPVQDTAVFVVLDGEACFESTDVDGRFAFEPLPPGSVRVFAHDDESGGVAETRVDLTEGATAWVELRLRQAHPARGSGRTTLGGAGASCQVVMRSVHGFMGAAESDASGAFRIELPDTGAWRGVVYPTEGLDPSSSATPSNLRYFELVVPAEGGFVLDLELDTLRPVDSFELLEWSGY